MVKQVISLFVQQVHVLTPTETMYMH